ncbi:MAG: CAP domain-containing protein [Sulfurovum sp.]|nr:CAP domain-containing protein [Sulfurovum sp.]
MKTTILASVLVASALLVGCGGGDSDTPSVETHPYDAPPISEAEKNSYLNAVNGARSVGRTCGQHGYFDPAPALSWNDALYKSSYEHSEDMEMSNNYSHTGSGTASDWTAVIMELGRGSNSQERAANNGFSGGGAENIAKGRPSTANVMGAWLASDGHCSAIMNSSHTQFGMAKVGAYHTQSFGF